MLDFRTIFTLMAAHRPQILAAGVAEAKAAGMPLTADLVKGAILNYATGVARQWLQPGVNETFRNAVSTYVAVAGVRPVTDVNEKDNVTWRDQFDEHIMDSIGQDNLRACGQDFIGEYLTDSEIDEPATLDAAVRVATDRLVEAAVNGRSAGQVLAEIGIVAEDLAPFVPAAPVAAAAVAPDKPIDEGVARGQVERLVGTWAIHNAAVALDGTQMLEMVKPCFDDEMFLALGYIERLGGTKGDWPYFLAYAKANPKHVEDTLQAATMAALTGAIVEAPKVPTGTANPAVKKGRKSKADKEAEAAAAAANAIKPPPPVAMTPPGTVPEAPGVDHAHIIRAIRQHSHMSEAEMGEVLGVSRGTINNIVNGKRRATLTPEMKRDLVNRVEGDIKGLSDVLAHLR